MWGKKNDGSIQRPHNEPIPIGPNKNKPFGWIPYHGPYKSFQPPSPPDATRDKFISMVEDYKRSTTGMLQGDAINFLRHELRRVESGIKDKGMQATKSQVDIGYEHIIAGRNKEFGKKENDPVEWFYIFAGLEKIIRFKPKSHAEYAAIKFCLALMNRNNNAHKNDNLERPPGF